MEAWHSDVLNRAESMKLFERDGKVYFGLWRRWWYAKPDERERVLAEFRRKGT